MKKKKTGKRRSQWRAPLDHSWSLIHTAQRPGPPPSAEAAVKMGLCWFSKMYSGLSLVLRIQSTVVYFCRDPLAAAEENWEDWDHENQERNLEPHEHRAPPSRFAKHLLRLESKQDCFLELIHVYVCYKASIYRNMYLQQPTRKRRTGGRRIRGGGRGRRDGRRKK